jgi:hypothetical protein
MGPGLFILSQLNKAHNGVRMSHQLVLRAVSPAVVWKKGWTFHSMMLWPQAWYPEFNPTEQNKTWDRVAWLLSWPWTKMKSFCSASESLVSKIRKYLISEEITDDWTATVQLDRDLKFSWVFGETLQSFSGYGCKVILQKTTVGLTTMKHLYNCPILQDNRILCPKVLDCSNETLSNPTVGWNKKVQLNCARRVALNC